MASSDCLFCKIIAGEETAEFVYQADDVVAFRDIYPQAPVHLLVVPTRHVPSAHDLVDDDALLGRVFAVAREVAEQEDVADGYRVATNVGSRGGQVIGHLHFHVLGGRQLGGIDSGGED